MSTAHSLRIRVWKLLYKNNYRICSLVFRYENKFHLLLKVISKIDFAHKAKSKENFM